jgi:arylsulfatase A-like enzyme
LNRSEVAWFQVAADGAPAVERPDLVLVSIDSLRADHLGCYGYERDTSPVIDALAAEGVRFHAAASTTSWTLPAHAAMLTGLNDSAHGVTDMRRRLSDQHVTLAERLRDAGYRTAGFFGGPFLHPLYGLDQGFEEWVNCMGGVGDDVSVAQLEHVMVDDPVMHGDVTGPRTLEAVRAWAAVDDPRPYFLFVHLWDVHYDYLAPPGYVELFDTDYEGPVTGLGFEDETVVHRRMGRRHLERLIALYDAEIRFTDEVLGQMLDMLREHGMLDDALVVITADHGEEFFDHGGKGHQETLFEEVLRVPLVFHWPGRVLPGHVVDRPVSLVSIAPTLLAAAGIDAVLRPGTEDLRPRLLGEDPPGPAVLAELLVQSPAYVLHEGDLKVYYEPGMRRPRYAYDLGADPRERNPFEPADDERAAALSLELERLVDQGLPHRAAAIEAERVELGEDLARVHGALGYDDQPPSEDDR